MSTENKQEVLDSAETYLADLTETINVNLKAFEKASLNLGKKGLNRVIVAALTYPEKPKQQFIDEMELQCYMLMIDILNARYGIALIDSAIKTVNDEKLEQ